MSSMPKYRYSALLPALQSMGCSGCVIYIGTFTKMLVNSLRLGFVVVLSESPVLSSRRCTSAERRRGVDVLASVLAL
jgi:DNA-binding transcriptional MocR family regulator